MQAKLSPEEMHQLKEDLWNGMEYKEIMEKYKVSYQIAVGVKAGRTYDYIPWPDGSTGAMSDIRKTEIANGKRWSAKAVNGSERATGNELTRIHVTTQMRYESDMKAREHGFINAAAEVEHWKNIRLNEERDAVNERQRIANLEYCEIQTRYEADPYAPEFAHKHRRPPHIQESLPDDQCDPDANEKIDWEEVLFLTQGRNKLVGLIGDEPTLQLAARIVFKLFPQRQWDQPHIAGQIYALKFKIENFWEANPDRAPKENEDV